MNGPLFDCLVRLLGVIHPVIRLVALFSILSGLLSLWNSLCISLVDQIFHERCVILAISYIIFHLRLQFEKVTEGKHLVFWKLWDGIS